MRAENVARVSTEFGARLFCVSTDYVFDGTSSRPYEPNDRRNLPNSYGASKANRESALRKYAKEWCIGRTSWLFGASGASFSEKILRASETRPELTVVADLHTRPCIRHSRPGPGRWARHHPHQYCRHVFMV
jgi:dTDP-4-dehydrorhamnose reductase